LQRADERFDLLGLKRFLRQQHSPCTAPETAAPKERDTSPKALPYPESSSPVQVGLPLTITFAF